MNQISFAYTVKLWLANHFIYTVYIRIACIFCSNLLTSHSQPLTFKQKRPKEFKYLDCKEQRGACKTSEEGWRCSEWGRVSGAAAKVKRRFSRR